MKAMVYHANKDLRFEDVEEPQAGPGEMKLRIDYCGICATDIEEYLYGPKFITAEPDPQSGRRVITGHELTGTVVEVGREVDQVRPGDRVVVDGFIPCNACWWCEHGHQSQCPDSEVVGFGRDGGLAEYMTWPAANAIALPDAVASEAAALNEPASVAHHAVSRGRIGAGDRVAVVGAGTVGLLAMQVAKSLGATVYAVDQRQMGLDVARDLGADGVVNSADDDAGEALREWTGGSGPDVVIDAAGAPKTPHAALDWVRRGGRVVLVAIYTTEPQFDFNTLVAAETELIGSLGYNRTDIEGAVGLIASGQVKTQPLVSGVIGLAEVIDVGYQRMLSPAKDVFRLLVAPSGG